MVDAQPVDEPLVDEFERLSRELLEDLRIIRTPARSPMSKNRRLTPVLQSRSKNFARSNGSRQNGF